MNNVSIIGNLVKEVELKISQSGKSFAKFTIAINSGYGDKKRADFPNCVAFGKTAEVISQYCQKGDKIGVIGRIQTSKYEDKGQTHYSTDIIVSEVIFLSNKKNDNQENTNDIDDEDIPF